MCVGFFTCIGCLFLFFFFKQKTAYEMLRSLVGSEMCIRDSHGRVVPARTHRVHTAPHQPHQDDEHGGVLLPRGCLLYTSDAADDLLCVDLGGRRIIKKKNTKNKET